MIKNAVTLWKQLNFAATSSVSSSLVTSQYWKSTAVIGGYKHRKKGPMTDNEQVLADELSAFCSQFDLWDVVAEQQQPVARVWMLLAEPVIISEDNRHHAFHHINFRMSPVRTTPVGKPEGTVTPHSSPPGPSAVCLTKCCLSRQGSDTSLSRHLYITCISLSRQGSDTCLSRQGSDTCISRQGSDTCLSRQ